jgi:response regulator RpfG family c-di-GMP phosphodiesterase
MTAKPRSSGTVLIVDSKENISSAQALALDYPCKQIFTAESAKTGLDFLAKHCDVDVVIANQKLADMPGIEFFRKTKALYPKILRVLVTELTELDTLLTAMNEQVIHKLIPKPCDRQLLIENIDKVLQEQSVQHENVRLLKELEATKKKLSWLTLDLEQQLAERTKDIVRNINLLQFSQDILQHLPVAILGIDEQDIIAVSNKRADEIFARYSGDCLLGLSASKSLPRILMDVLKSSSSVCKGEFDGGLVPLSDDFAVHVWVSPMQEVETAKGIIVVLLPFKIS